jgi:hypothetical protein
MAGSSPIDVLVPGKLEGLARDEPFVVRDGIAKLHALYGDSPEGVQGWLSFDAYGASRARMDPTWPHRLAGADLAVAALVGDAPTDAQVDAVLAAEIRDRIEPALAAVPTDWALQDALPPESWDRLAALYAATEVPALDLRRLTRLLCVKRPRLVPYVPAHGRGGNRGRSLAEVALDATRQLREVILRNRLALSEITASMNAWLDSQTPPHRRVRITPARTLSELLAFEIGGWRRFAGWEEKGGEVRRKKAPAAPRAARRGRRRP